MKQRYILPTLAVLFVLTGTAAIFSTGARSLPSTSSRSAEGKEFSTSEVQNSDSFRAGEFSEEAKETATPVPTALPDTQPEAEQTARAYTDADAEILAKIVWAEARGVKTTAEKAAIIWCVLNRYDAGTYGNSIVAVATAPHQFAYRESAPVEPEFKELALDVLSRWQAEKEGAESPGRVLPVEYVFFDGDGTSNHFRKEYSRSGSTWNWSLKSPYEEDGA